MLYAFFCGRIFFIVLRFHSLFLHSPADIHLGYFQFGATVNKAAVNITSHYVDIWFIPVG